MALRPLSRIDDFRFPEEAWDVRGWTVRTEAGEHGEKVGRVDDMLLDRTGTLRYLDVDLGFLKKHILVPLDHAHADREAETVWIEDLTKDEMEAVPEYALDPEALDEDYERRLDAVYGGTRASTHNGLVAPQEDPEAELDVRRMTQLEDEYQVAGDDPRGWTVVTGDGQAVGKVAELLMEPGAMKALFLDAVVDEKALELEPVDRHILLPTESVRLDRQKKKVVLSGLLAHDLADYPQYGGLPVTRKAASRIQAFFDRAGTGESERPPEERERGTDADPPGHDWRESTLNHFYRGRPRERSQAAEEDARG